MERVIIRGGIDHYSTESPLSRFIKDYIPRAGNPIPKMTFYNGKGDPYEHVTKYERLMRLAGHDDTIICQMFEVYLKDSAQGRYKILLPNSIDSYDQLPSKFLKNFDYN